MNHTESLHSRKGKDFSTRILFFSLTLALSCILASCGVESGRFKVSGRFLNMDQGEFYVYSPDGAMQGIDTIRVMGGRFTYERAIDREATLMLVFPNFSEQPIFTQSGKSVEVKADASHIKEMEVTGTKANQLMTQFRKQTASSSPPDVAKKAEEFVAQHPESPVGAYLVRKYFIQTLSPDYAKAERLVSQMLQSQPKNGSLVLLRKQLSQLKSGMEGQRLPTFTAPDAYGGKVSDADVSTGVAVVCVWSSWNYESQDMLRQLKRHSREAGGRLKVLTINLDADKKACTQILERDTIRWPNVYDGLLFESPTLGLLGLSSVPDNLVLKDRRIVARGLNNAQLKEKLDQLLGMGK